MARLNEILAADAQRAVIDEQELKAAKARLKRSSLEKWRSAVTRLEIERATRVRQQADAEAAYRAACSDVAMGKAGAEEKQRSALEKLKDAKADAELSLGALVAAEAERDAAQRADSLVRQAAYDASRAADLVAAKKAASDRLDAHIANMRALHESDRELGAALSAVGLLLDVPPYEKNPLEGGELSHAIDVLYAATLPRHFPPGRYDLLRKFLTGDPDSMHPPPPTPTWETFRKHLN
jgi:hypothetical protein